MDLICDDILIIKEDISFKKIYDTELDNETSIIYDICEIFHSKGNIKFIVSGFGYENWLMDCRFDLPGIIEEVPQIINKIRKEEYNFKLDFYEQGTEREIIFEEVGGKIKLICFSRISWTPIPNIIEMNKEDVKLIFENLYSDFIKYSKVLCDDLINDPLLSNWLKLMEK